MFKGMTRKQRKTLIRILIGLVLFLSLHLAEELPVPVQLTICLIGYAIVGYDIVWKAVRNIGHGQVFDENFLMVVATAGAIVLGEFHEGVEVMLFYQIGEFFQSYAVGRSRKNITQLMDIRPDYANISADSFAEGEFPEGLWEAVQNSQDGELTQISPDEIPVGTVITVRTGEKIPIDGVVVEGESTLNTAALTGESMPREVFRGSEVISGCINMTGPLKIRTTKEFGESTVSKILELVENSGFNKSNSERFITRFARIYTPIVVFGALIVAIIPPLVRMGLMGLAPEWNDWVFRALTFLVISCPCALVISIPLSFFAGIGGASRSGILIKGANYLESLSKTKQVVFDKTGTMTKGVFEVVAIHHAPVDDQKLLELAAHVEAYSTHPISECLRKAYKGTIDTDRIESIKEHGGHGIVAVIDDCTVIVGNEKLLAEQGIKGMFCHSHGSIVHVAVDGAYFGHIVIRDMLKPTSVQAVQALHQNGVRETVMLTGDREEVAREVADELGITDVQSGLLPEDKVRIVEEMMAKTKEKEAGGKHRSILAFVGDGINDAPVLARADVGVAMGALGADAAIEAADIVLMDDDPLKIAEAIRISRKCMRIVRENIVGAIGIKVLVLVLSAIGMATMELAIFADVGVMILAVLNAMRALRVNSL